MRAQKVASSPIPGIASPYRRLGARAIDFLAALFILYPISLTVPGILFAGKIMTEEQSRLVGFVSFGFLFLLMILYDTVMTALWGKTLGKMALGLVVVDINGNKPGWGRAFARAILFYLLAVVCIFGFIITASILGWVLLVGLGRYQTFPHDTATRTYVMLKKQKGPVVLAPPVTPHDDLEKLRQAGLISDEEYQRKRQEMKY